MVLIAGTLTLRDANATWTSLKGRIIRFGEPFWSQVGACASSWICRIIWPLLTSASHVLFHFVAAGNLARD